MSIKSTDKSAVGRTEISDETHFAMIVSFFMELEESRSRDEDLLRRSGGKRRAARFGDEHEYWVLSLLARGVYSVTRGGGTTLVLLRARAGGSLWRLIIPVGALSSAEMANVANQVARGIPDSDFDRIWNAAADNPEALPDVYYPDRPRGR